MNEVFPVVSGLLLGALIGGIRPSIRLWVAVPLAVLLGVTATVISGEFKISWEYLLIDIPLVAISAMVSFVLARKLRRATTS
jgi:hypothetical protein